MFGKEWISVEICLIFQPLKIKLKADLCKLILAKDGNSDLVSLTEPFPFPQFNGFALQVKNITTLSKGVADFSKHFTKVLELVEEQYFNFIQMGKINLK